MFQQIQRPLHRSLTTAHLAQSMSLLHLSADELREAVEHELASNPALEQVESPVCPACGRRTLKAGPCPVCTVGTAEVVVFTSPAEQFQTREAFAGRDPYQAAENAEIAEVLPLAAHLLRQLGPELEPDDRPIAAHLLTALDEDGLLINDPAEVAAYFHVPRLRVESIRRMIQRAEPFGCASSSPQEALSIQIQILKEVQNVPPLVEACLEHFDLLARHRHAELAEKLGLKEGEVVDAARFIGANLNPYPARAHWGGTSAPQPVYRTPDVVIRLSESTPGATLIVEIAQPFAGSLRVNPLFRRAIHEAADEKIEAWQADLERARSLIKCASQRAGALELLLARLALLQREFILHGDAHLRPLTRSALARELKLHESTVSRAVAGKSVLLPNGRIVPLALFFKRHLSVRVALRELVDAETQPLSDTELARRLGQMGFQLSRRTVTKYRLMEGILPSHLRG